MPTIPHPHFLTLSIARGNQLREHFTPDPTEWPPEGLGFARLDPGQLLFLPIAEAAVFTYDVCDARGLLLNRIPSPPFNTLTAIEWYASEDFPIRNALYDAWKGRLREDDEVGRMLGLVRPRRNSSAAGVDLSDLIG